LQCGFRVTLAGAIAASLSLAAGASGPSAGLPTFNKDVAPILLHHCVQCHSSGEIASRVPLSSYDAARPWAKAIKEKVLLREMPPWPADPNQSLKFRNDARLSRQDIDMLVAWVNAGAPKGSDSDLAPAPFQAQGWRHPQGRPPDAVISLPAEVQLPATGEIPYARFLTKVPFSEDKWVVAAQVRPGNGAVVHHMAITEVELPNGMKPAELRQFALLARQLGLPGGTAPTRPAVTPPAHPEAFDMLGMYTPGTTFETYSDDGAKLLKGGDNLYFNFNIHYTTTGKPERDRSELALWFQPAPPKHQVYRVPSAIDAIIVEGRELLSDAPGEKAEGASVGIPPVPPHAANYEVIGVTAYTTPVTIYQFQPHAHLRAKDFRYTVVYPDGREQTVLSVPKYDFHWQLAYELETPLRLPAGSKLVVTAHYDNSANNKNNPSPEKEVYFRTENQSVDEMFTPFVQYSVEGAAAVDIAEADGCLEPGPSDTWMRSNASDPIPSATQATTAEAIQAAGARWLGNRKYQLLGVAMFHPIAAKGARVAIKGALIKDAGQTRLNVTSLQPLSATCP